jgi:hypothetical protein
MVMYIHNIAIIPRAISWRIYPELVVWIIHRSTSIETKSKGLYITHLSNGSIFFRHIELISAHCITIRHIFK